ncbi:MAG: hypothetical protein JOS17DRAFT_697727, partial [Linnemannia elongata]
MKIHTTHVLLDPNFPSTNGIQLRHLITATSLFTGVVFKVDTLCLQGCVMDNGLYRCMLLYICLSEHSKCGGATTISGGAGGAGGAGQNSNTSVHEGALGRPILASFIYAGIFISLFFFW